MKRTAIILTNVLIIACILLFVFLYSYRQHRQSLDDQVRSFENMTVAAEQVTATYLKEEQHLCDVWANYITSSAMTMEEAVDFVRSCHISTEVAGHLIYTDDGSLAGLSTRKGTDPAGSNAVSYRDLDLFPDIEHLDTTDEALHITPAYTDPLNGRQVIAFYNNVTLSDGAGGTRSALLLRVIPLALFDGQWTFLRGNNENADYSLIDSQGRYIIRGQTFTGISFYDYYERYNRTDPEELEELKQVIPGSPGSLEMTAAGGERCLLAHAPLSGSQGWAALSTLPVSDLGKDTTDWLLIGVVAAALILLMAFDLALLLQMNKSLQYAAQDAEAANRAKTDFLSTMSHDIRTPMNAIVGLTSIAERNLEDPQSIRDSLRKIGLASSHLLTLINDILDISKVESGKLNLSPVSFSIVESAENLVNISQPMVKEKSIDFSFRIHGMEREYLYADQLRLNQIFINILSNAVKYTEPFGSVRVDLREEESAFPGRVKLTYVVADTGMGMSKEFMDRMYQPFSRQTDSRVNSIQGTGLGLAITKQMVDLMEGTIDCESRVGEGTTFTVTLDIPVADRPPEELHLSPMDVLVADDDVVLLETAQHTLSAMGVRAEIADSGARAVEMVSERHSTGEDYSVVILDWKMPDMDGIETARRIRSLVGERVPILLISSYDWSDIEEAARGAGVDGFISKPLFRSTLYDKLSEILGMEELNRCQEDDNSDVEGMNVLVAEDNDMNWEVISTLLEMYDIRCERTENGQLTVERMQAPGADAFDLIFMDVQMPVMNGLDATRAIRKLPDKTAASIPIIAMTADAFSENVAECLAAGMNGHIPKPIDMKLVLKELRRVRTANEP